MSVLFIDYTFAVFVVCTIDFKNVQLSYSVPGLIYRCNSVERGGKIFPVSFLFCLARLLNSALPFSLNEALLVIGFPDYFFRIFLFYLLVFVIDCSTRAWRSVFFYLWYRRFLRKMNFFIKKTLWLELQQIVID